MLHYFDGNPWPARHALPAIVALGVIGWALIFGAYEFVLYLVQ